MQYKRLGNTGLLISNICLGTMIFGAAEPRRTSCENALRMIDAFIDAGGNHLDTANVYAAKIDLTPQQLTQPDDASQPAELYPYRMIRDAMMRKP